MFGDVGGTIKQIVHHYSNFNWIMTGTDMFACEGTSHGEHEAGPWRAGVPEWGAGRWCDVFEVRDFLIQRCFIYLDPDYAGRRQGPLPLDQGRDGVSADDRDVHHRRDDDRLRRRARSTISSRVLRRHRPAVDGRQPRPPALRARAACSSTSRVHRLASRRACRCRSATASWPRPPTPSCQRARDLRLLAAGRPDRRRVPRRRPARPLRQHQLDRDRRLRLARDAPARRRRRARDRGVGRRR